MSNNHQTICTIITNDHMPFALALHQSLKQFNSEIILNVLVTSGQIIDKNNCNNLIINYIDRVTSDNIEGQEIQNKYRSKENTDKLRWAMKPVFIQYLLVQGYNQVIFTDPDTFYFNDYQFLFEKLKSSSVLLTPHWMGLDAEIDEHKFNYQFSHGLFNGGFIGVNSSGLEMMKWWAEACLYKCEKDLSTGSYVDQHYLNLMPIYFDNVEILKHQGCNLADWNRVVCRRELVNDQLLINGKWPVIFVHFTRVTIEGIVQGRDPHLALYLDQYIEFLNEQGFELNLLEYQYNPPSLFRKFQFLAQKGLRKISKRYFQ